MNSYIMKKIIRVLFIWLILLMAFISSAQLIFASTNVGGRISTNTTWTLAGSPYIVTSSVSVYGTPTQTAKLTIEPGVQVKFNANYYIQIGYGTNKGALYAVGTEGNSIVFTSNKTTPARGDWDSIKFLDATDDALTAMTYCTVEYGGSNSSNGNIYLEKMALPITNCTARYSKYIGIRCNNASPTITGGSIVSNNTNGIYASTQSLLTINGTSFSGNGSNAISVGANDEIFSTQGITGVAGDRVEIRSGTVDRDQSWRNLGIPYRISGNISVYKDATTAAKLTIDPGVQVRFNGNYYIQISTATNKGALYAVGTEVNPIIFTSDKPSPARGDWDSIKFYDATDDSLTAMTYCTVEYGGSNSSYGNVYIQKAAPTITNCTIRYSKYIGVGCNNASPIITGGTIADNNTKGINASGQSLITIDSTSFSGNGSYAISQGANDELFSTQGITGSAGDRVEIRSGTVDRDQSWRNLGIPYRISGNISVYKDATTAAKLTIDPGVQVRFNGNYYIQISTATNKGALYAVGTEVNPIIFTSDKPSPARGDWDSIKFLDATDDGLTQMAYCTVEYGGSSNSNGSIYVEKAAPTITNCTARFSKYMGIRCNNASPTITGGSIVDNNTYGIYTIGLTLLTINGTSFSGNGSSAISLGVDDEIFSTQGISADRIEIRSGTISRNQTWRNLGVPYRITGNISVYKDTTTAATLTIEPGVQIKFNGDFGIAVSSGTYKGALYAVGTEANPIIFTSDKPTPARGDWGNIKFLDATDDALTAMTYCTVEYGGSNSSYGNIYLEKAAATITNCTARFSKYMGIRCNNASPTITGGSIVDNNTYGIYTIGLTLLTINGTSFSGNGSSAISLGVDDEIFSTQGISADRIEIRSGTISRNKTWRNLGVPYRISGHISIYKDSTTSAKLTIEPGVQVRFSGGYSISIGSGTYKGALYAVGTEDNPILFTSDKPNPQPGDWLYIMFNDATDGPSTEMAYCTVEYGGSGSDVSCSVYISQAQESPRISNCTIRYSNTNGIRCAFASLTLNFCNIYNNNIGISSNYSTIQVNHCNIFNNTQFGVRNETANDYIVDARFNWWGHPSGPRGQGSGSGDAVTNYVVYEPWLGLSYSSSYYISEGFSTTKQLTTNGGQTVLYAKAYDDSNWTILIKDASQQTVKTFTESGIRIRQTWDGKDQSGQPLPKGSYSYQIQAQRQSDLSEATPLLGTISIDNIYGVCFISSPLAGDCIAGTVIYIIGTAVVDLFEDYKLEYGPGAVPSDWVRIKQSSSPVTNGLLGSIDLSSLDTPYVTFRLTTSDMFNRKTISTYIYVSPYHVNASPSPFSPNNDGKKDTITISAQFGMESNWTLIINDPTGQNIIRTWSGSGNSMSQQWDGRDESGVLQNSGIYPIIITVSNPSLSVPDVVNGTIMLDCIYPMAQITDPVEEELFSNVYDGAFLTEIFGTASDENFVSYKLEYGESFNPTSWYLIGEYNSQMTNNKLGELDNSLLTNGAYTIRLTVLDLAENQSSAIVHIRVGHLRLYLSSHQLNTAQFENLAITTVIPFDSTETIVIKDKDLNIRKTLVDNLVRSAGTFIDSWDGKDYSGINLPQGAYYVVVSIIVTQDQKYFLMDLANTGGVRRPLYWDPWNPPFNFTCPSSFSPYNGDIAEITFDLDEPSMVDLFVKENLETGRERNILKKEPLALGSYSIYWDGTDDNGVLLDKSVSGLDNFIVFWAYSLADNCVVVYGEKPEVTSLSANPIYFCPVDKNLPDGMEISYSISKASNVNIYVQNSQGSIVRTMNLGTQSSGLHTVFWDGRTNTGDLADNGAYRIGIGLSDSLGNNSLIRYCLFILYY